MRISYNKLWKMLIDKNMKKSDLKDKAGISSASVAKLGKGDNITTDILIKICEAMDCHLEDIMETVDDQPIAEEKTGANVKCTPFVRQVWYNTCIRKWGVFLCQKEDRINDTQGSSSRWLWRP